MAEQLQRREERQRSGYSASRRLSARRGPQAPGSRPPRRHDAQEEGEPWPRPAHAHQWPTLVERPQILQPMSTTSLPALELSEVGMTVPFPHLQDGIITVHTLLMCLHPLEPQEETVPSDWDNTRRV